MSTAARLVTALARSARRIPLGEQTAARVLGRIRKSATARKVVSRVFDFETSGDAPTVFLSSGNVLSGEGRDNLPVVLVSLLGASPNVIAERLDYLAQEQLLTAGFRPVVLIDADHFAAVRQYGWPVEHLISHSRWATQDQGWFDYMATRFHQLRTTYSAKTIVDLVHAPTVASHILRSFSVQSRSPEM